MKIVLASGSPRRRELLSGLGLDFEVIPDNLPENAPKGLSPDGMVEYLAKFKCQNVAEKLDSALVIAADTVVAADGRVLGKPRDEQDAAEMLKMLSGREHCVYTGFAVMNTHSGKLICSHEMTAVRFREMTNFEIEAYIATNEPMDKAGAYGIQEKGALFVEAIRGDYFNVVGLPVCRLGRVLKQEFNIDLLKLQTAQNTK